MTTALSRPSSVCVVSHRWSHPGHCVVTRTGYWTGGGALWPPASTSTHRLSFYTEQRWMLPHRLFVCLLSLFVLIRKFGA